MAAYSYADVVLAIMAYSGGTYSVKEIFEIADKCFKENHRPKIELVFNADLEETEWVDDSDQ